AMPRPAKPVPMITTRVSIGRSPRRSDSAHAFEHVHRALDHVVVAGVGVAVDALLAPSLGAIDLLVEADAVEARDAVDLVGHGPGPQVDAEHGRVARVLRDEGVALAELGEAPE